MTFVQPFRFVPSDGYCVVWDAIGQVVAQGSKGMCERVVAGLPVLARAGSLFHGL